MNKKEMVITMKLSEEISTAMRNFSLATDLLHNIKPDVSTCIHVCATQGGNISDLTRDLERVTEERDDARESQRGWHESYQKSQAHIAEIKGALERVNQERDDARSRVGITAPVKENPSP